MPYDGLSQRAPRMDRTGGPHGSDLVVKSRTHILFRTVYEFGWNARNAILDRPQPLWGTCRPPLRLAAPPCCAQLDLVVVHPYLDAEMEFDRYVAHLRYVCFKIYLLRAFLHRQNIILALRK